MSSTELMVPGVGQVVNLEDAGECALALDALRDLEYQLRMAKTELTRALVHASQQAGTKTLHLPGAKATISGGSETQYDADALIPALLASGMSPERVSEIVVETVTYKVSAVEAKRAAEANPVYAEIIDAHTTTVEKAFSVSVSLHT